LRALSGALLAGLVVVVASGCGTGGIAKDGNASSGKSLFTQGPPTKQGVPPKPTCGSCHTLADAGTQGQAGPNLDHAFQRSREEGFKESTIANVVLDQIRYPTSGSGMPANLLKGQDAQDVAAYVASVAGKVTQGGTTPATRTGKDLYTSLGCLNCHTLDGSPSSGPTFKGLFGSKVKLTNGQTVMADEAYLLESILDPDKEIVQGYQPGGMTSVIKKGQVSMADSKKLADFIKQQQ
jgi:mono/diheme cytochrome c family protein